MGPGGAAALVTAPIIAVTLPTCQGTLAIMVTHAGPCAVDRALNVWHVATVSIGRGTGVKHFAVFTPTAEMR